MAGGEEGQERLELAIGIRGCRSSMGHVNRVEFEGGFVAGGGPRADNARRV